MAERKIKQFQLIRTLGPRTVAGIPLTCLGNRNTDRPVPQYVQGPRCGYDQVEIWSDANKANCDKCGIIVLKDHAIYSLEKEIVEKHMINQKRGK